MTMIMNLKYQKSLYTDSSGFTLVEILIGLTLLSLIMLLLFSSLHTAGKSWSSGEDKITRTDELRLASQFIRQRLSQSVPIIWISKNERRIAFKGTGEEINFVSPLPAHRGGGGLYLLTLKLDSDHDQQHLVLHYRLALPDRQTFNISAQGEHESAVLAENISRIVFSYFGSTEPDEEPQWQDRWDVEDQLPKMVRIKLSPEDSLHEWPEMLVTLPSQTISGQPQFYQFAGNDLDTSDL